MKWLLASLLAVIGLRWLIAGEIAGDTSYIVAFVILAVMLVGTILKEHKDNASPTQGGGSQAWRD